MAAAEMGAQRAQPAAATAARSAGSLTSLDPPLTPTAPIRVPPNQAAPPRSCMARMTVLRLLVICVPPDWRDERNAALTRHSPFQPGTGTKIRSAAVRGREPLHPVAVAVGAGQCLAAVPGEHERPVGT